MANRCLLVLSKVVKFLAWKTDILYQPRYSVLVAGAIEDADSQEKNQHDMRWTEYRPHWLRYWEKLMNFVSFMMFLGGVAMLAIARNPSEQECAARTSTWSPLADAVEFKEFNFQNSFSHKTEYRGPPTREREMAWDRLFNFPSLSIPDSSLQHINRIPDAERYVRASAPDLAPGFLAGIEVFHHLHCLNLIRQYTWLDYYDVVPVGLVKDDPVMNRMHVDHCIETLRLTLQCNADITPYLVVRADNSTLGAKADFDSFHKCKRFDRLVDWMDEHAAVQQTPKEDPNHGHV